MFGSRSEEVTTICVGREILSRTKETTLNRVVSLVKVDRVDLNIRTLNTIQRVISGKDENVLTSRAGGVDEQIDFVGFGSGEVMSLTTVNVENVSVLSVNNLQKLTTQLFCEKNTGSNNNDSPAVVDVLKILHNVVDHRESFTTTSGHDDLTLVMNQHGVTGALLVGAELHQYLVDMAIIRQKGPRGEGPVTLRRLSVSVW